MTDIADMVNDNGGAGIIIDYGYNMKEQEREEKFFKDTLQSMIKHRYCHILENIGDADISSHVDFHNLQLILEKKHINFSYSTQAEFLKIFQLDLIVENLMKKSKQIQNILRQYQKLTSFAYMGNFKVLQFYNTL